MRLSRLLLISCVTLLFLAESVSACICTEYDVPICAHYWRADAVFAGQLIDITPVEKISPRQMPTVMLHFIVEQPFRGISGDRVDVETLHGTECDMAFEKGERYLIYASLEEGGKKLFADSCTRTGLLKNRDDDLTYIQSLNGGDVKESIIGRLLEGRYSPISAVKVIIEGEGQTVETSTDDKGDFRATVARPGNYTVRAFIPFAAAVMAYNENEKGQIHASDKLTTFEYPVKLEKTQCQYRQIEVYPIDLHATAEVSGNVLTGSGRPVTTGHVNLINAADSSDSIFKEIGEDGSFKFEGVAVGEYYLVLNPRNEAPGENDAPYPRTYYPSSPDKGTKLVITEGAKLENLILRVGRAWREQEVKGTIVWPDGSAPSDANVAVYDGDRYIKMVKADEKGRFAFKVYGDFKYAILGRVWGPKSGQTSRLLLSNKSTGLKLVLKPND